MVDKDFCMSSYLAFRYIEKEDVDFKEEMKHKNIKKISDESRILVKTSENIDNEIRKQFDNIQENKLGVLLSGGMDSAILASYMPYKDAYTFRFLDGKYQKEELERAEYYARYYKLKLHYVDINWNTVEKYLPIVLKQKCAPVHSIEPQLLQAAIQAKEDGIERLIIGESSDLIFGGMDKLLSKDWKYNEFKERYIFTEPKEVLKNPVDIDYLFARYKKGESIDFLSFLDDVFAIESSSSYMNAFSCAEVEYTDPYAVLKMAEPLDLNRIRNGESKYLIRNLFAKKYPEIPIPEKVPMPRPVDEYFKCWKGPNRKEFKRDINISKFTGNQKWQIYCLNEFLNLFM